jgi:hypothetical protein
VSSGAVKGQRLDVPPCSLTFACEAERLQCGVYRSLFGPTSVGITWDKNNLCQTLEWHHRLERLNERRKIAVPVYRDLMVIPWNRRISCVIVGR